MGILNYPMALFCAIFMAHFARIAPASSVSLVKNLWIGAWLAASSPLGLFVIANFVNPQGTPLANELPPSVRSEELMQVNGVLQERMMRSRSSRTASRPASTY